MANQTAAAHGFGIRITARCGSKSERMRHALCRLCELRDKIGRKKRRVGGDGDNCLGPLPRSPIETGQNPHQRPRETGDRIGQHWQGKGVEPRRITVGIQRHRPHLRG